MTYDPNGPPTPSSPRLAVELYASELLELGGLAPASLKSEAREAFKNCLFAAARQLKDAGGILRAAGIPADGSASPVAPRRLHPALRMAGLWMAYASAAFIGALVVRFLYN